MGKYKCNNKDCKQYNEIVTANTHIIYKKEGTIDNGAPCPECGQIREMVFEGLCTSFLPKGNPNLCNK